MNHNLPSGQPKGSAVGYLIGILAAAFYGTNPFFALPLYADGLHPDAVLFWRYLLAVPMLAVLVILKREDIRIRSLREGVLLLVMGVLMAVSSLTLFESYNFMDVGIASTLLFLYPLLVALIMSARYGERIGLRGWLCLVAAFGGILLLCKNGEGATISFIGALLVFISSLTYAIYIVSINKTSLCSESSLKIIFWVLVVGILVYGMQMTINSLTYRPDTLAEGMVSAGYPLIPSGPSLWLWAVGLALFPTALSFWMTTVAIHRIGSTPTAILGVFEPVTAVFISLFVFGEVLSVRESVGVVVILLSVSVFTAGAMIARTARRTLARHWRRGGHN